MSTDKHCLRFWLARAKELKAEYMIVVCDSFEYEDYPIYTSAQSFARYYQQANGRNMQKIMEVYDLSLDIEAQLNETRAFHYPPDFPIPLTT